jgi:HEAT repeat protein
MAERRAGAILGNLTKLIGRPAPARLSIAVSLLLLVGAAVVGGWLMLARIDGPTPENGDDKPADNTPASRPAAEPTKASADAEDRHNRELIDKLNAPITKEIAFDADTPLKEALDFISHVFDIPIAIDEAAFKAVDPAADATTVPVRFQNMNKGRLSTVLWLLLKQLQFGFVIDRGRVLVVPGVQPRQKNERLPPALAKAQGELRKRLRRRIDKEVGFSSDTPLKEALGFISDVFDITILFDEAAFKATDPNTDPKTVPVRLGRSTPHSLKALLSLVLDPVEAGYEIVDDFLLIVPGRTVSTLGEVIADEAYRVSGAVTATLDRQRDLLTRGLRTGQKALHDKLEGLQNEVAVSILVGALKDPKPAVRFQAAAALSELGNKAAGAVPALAEALEDAEAAVRVQAAYGLSRVKPAAARSAVGALGAALQDENEAVRSHAAHALALLAPEAGAASADLAVALKDRHPAVRRLAVEALARIGGGADVAVPALIRALKDPDPQVRANAPRALLRIKGTDILSDIGVDNKDTVPALIDLLDDPEAADRLGVVQVLVGIGADVVPHLTAALRHNNDNIRHAAGEALAQLGPTAATAIPDLIDMLTGNGRIERTRAAGILGRIGPAAVPALLDVLKDREKDNRCLAALALGHVGRAGRVALPALSAALRDQDADVRRHAVDALWQIGPDQENAVTALLEALKDSEESIRNRAVEALAQSERRGIPMLIAALKDKDQLVRRGTAEALGLIGPGAKRALPALKEALADPNTQVRAAAAQALRRIQDER